MQTSFYRLLALDIDGTILNSNSELTPRTRDAILQAKDQGVTVVLATGRRLTMTLPFIEALGLEAPVVIHNGAVIYDPLSERALYQQGIDLAVAQDIVDKLESCSVNYVIYTGESGGERVVAPLGNWNEPEDLLTHYLGENAEFVEKVQLVTSPVRISLIDTVEKIDLVVRDCLDLHENKFHAMQFGTERNIWRGIEIIPKDCNKGRALAHVVELLGLRAEDTVAIGDNVNDLEMIAWAGLGVAMENGAQVLKDRADRIAPSHDQDGVAQIIEKLLL